MCAASMGRDREVELLVSASKEHLSAEKYQVRGFFTAGNSSLCHAAAAACRSGHRCWSRHLPRNSATPHATGRRRSAFSVARNKGAYQNVDEELRS